MKSIVKIILGMIYLILALIYLTDKRINGGPIELFDRIGWTALFVAGSISIVEELRIKGNKPIMRNYK